MRFSFLFKKITQGVILTLLVFIIAYIVKSDINIGKLFLSENLPYFNAKGQNGVLFKLNPASGYTGGEAEMGTVPDETLIEGEAINAEDEKNGNIEAARIEINEVSLSGVRLVGLDEGIFQPETDHENTGNHNLDEVLTIADIDKLRDLSYLKNKFYIVDPKTDISPDLFNVDTFLAADLKINKSEEPKILVFHTHSQEMFVNSSGVEEGIISVGDALVKALSVEYGINAIHNTDSFDIVDGKSQILGAYERMEPVIMDILKKNPSIEMVIDLHRDGLPEGVVKQTVMINGRQTAQIMFFNGLTRLMENGELKEIEYLPNNYLETNLALSFNMQLAANSVYPGFTKKVYLNAYRYSLHMMPKSLFVEVGSQYNTKEEAQRAAEPLAEIIARVVN